VALNPQTVAELAEIVDRAHADAREIEKLTDRYPDMSVADGYTVMEALIARRQARGHRIVGYKLGLTSRAKMQQMGVGQPGYGVLFDDFAVPDGGTVAVGSLIHPKIEPEIALVTRAPLRGPGVHVGTVLAAADFVLPAMEIIDSRYKDFRFDMPSVVADNSSSARFVTGGRSLPADQVDLRTLGLVMEKNGEIVGLGCGAAVLGHPAAAVAMLANILGAKEQEIPAGTFIMTGGITAAVAVAPGDHVTTHYQGLGSISVRFV
jgi:2-oxo-3-hexenedioate decarboxylase